MLGSELKETRLKLGLSQVQFAKKLYINQGCLSKMEAGIIKIPPFIEVQFEKIVDEETSTSFTNKVFSKELFLKDMLTGNEVIDEIYLNAYWLNALDGKQALEKKFNLIIENKITQKRKTKSHFCKYIINYRSGFYCKLKWLKNI